MSSNEMPEFFRRNISTLRELSKDDSNEKEIHYMTESEIEAVDFDVVKTKYANELGLSEEVAKSVDALLYKSEQITFIEFKNGKMNNQKNNVKDKIKDSLLIFCEITGKTIADTRKETDMILVYNEKKNLNAKKVAKDEVQRANSLTTIAKHCMRKGNQEFILFGLEKFKTLYFRKVHTYTEKEFEKFLIG
jgi:hypothetical protein